MIVKEKVEGLVMDFIGERDLFLVEVQVRPGNQLTVLVDSPAGIPVDTCVELSRFLNEKMDREEEDYALEVSSPGLGSPLKVAQQYLKNLGREVEVVLGNGEKIKGKLLSLEGNRITVEAVMRIADPGNPKKKRKETEEKSWTLDDIKTTRVIVSFK
ncbi:MAG: ribosome assembly cofactor RimP [Bacteroidota bacterium]